MVILSNFIFEAMRLDFVNYKQRSNLDHVRVNKNGNNHSRARIAPT